ncbi:ABC transporter substrate-binding protein [Ruegeria sp. 1NDH52C]|uniref:ABC transporter substrate-binding protein n=1 Tax=Ruegeria alba TaxID=2916756 RepID=A0ABS9NRQ8_9RHOB|nr:ABC transporter substrate-binding protein [Ruegeria alba]MCE8521324.1 ABC transporter substrate-binding protein [Ruegeria pomeroyi]MCG6556908.1 ABC transporter substrate-binding protein [Ruegeria alba]
MKFYKSGSDTLPTSIENSGLAQGPQNDDVSRREFLAMATTFGATTATAYSMLGMNAPALASETPKIGGTIRIGMVVRAGKDPRSYDDSPQANISRGWLEYLVRYTHAFTFEPMLLESWEISEDAKTYILNVRPGVTWHNGDALTAEHVAYNIARWCEKDVEGNSMAGRFGTLIDAETGKAADGTIEVVDDMTVRLNLPNPDITLIAGMADYPAAVVHPSAGSADPFLAPMGTGPYTLESHEAGVKAVLVRKEGHTWWNEGNGAYLDRIEYVDVGTDPTIIVASYEAEEIDANYESSGEFVDVLTGLDLVQNEAVTAATIVLRTNQFTEVNGQKPYADARVRRALSMAVDNNVLLELGVNGLGITAQNHHVCPIHPEYAKVDRLPHDPAGAMVLLKEAGMEDYEHDLISIDDDWRKNTTDAMAAQLRDAGIKVKRTVIPGASFWNDWAKFPFSSTNWNMRPLGVQILALAYRSGEAWNETGFDNAEFDNLLAEALATPDADKRRDIMARLEAIMLEEGVVTQPYWRSLYNHNRPHVKGMGMHPTFEIHIDKIWLDG